ncbi:hypothetical protein LCGC14_2371130 [marine sediment metagenome]|uniref:Uncharacterized protein n=1 Tax=marine sediment metagenome TaxID=412755 RepID=A0A0F9C3P9_9ZZZZ
MRLGHKVTGIKNTISIWLDYSYKTTAKAMYCLGCGYAVLQYYDNVKMAVPGEGPKDPNSKPIMTIQCKNAQCKMKYDVFIGASNA